jgi:hypothetical protein
VANIREQRFRSSDVRFCALTQYAYAGALLVEFWIMAALRIRRFYNRRNSTKSASWIRNSVTEFVFRSANCSIRIWGTRQEEFRTHIMS